jgi:hypothetical protein
LESTHAPEGLEDCRADFVEGLQASASAVDAFVSVLRAIGKSAATQDAALEKQLEAQQRIEVTLQPAILALMAAEADAGMLSPLPEDPVERAAAADEWWAQTIE